jgi:hypothetical protein
MTDPVEVKMVGLAYYQSLGMFRQNIAEAFGLH